MNIDLYEVNLSKYKLVVIDNPLFDSCLVMYEDTVIKLRNEYRRSYVSILNSLDVILINFLDMDFT
jgi:hypothetical protein